MSLDFLVPVVTYPDPTPKEGLVRALDMAASITGRLSVVVQTVDIPPLHNVLAEVLVGVSAMARETERQSRARAEELGAELGHIARRLFLPVTIETEFARPEAAVARMVAHARTHDATLIVLDTESTEQRDLAEAILFGSGGPVLICPPHEGPGHLRTVAIAWDGSRAAARAVRDALPVLRMATVVRLLTIADDKPVDGKSIDGVRALLAYHGVTGTHLEASLGGRPVGDALQEAALLDGAGLLVMGAYGHGRYREFVLGGATLSALNRPQMPIFMSH